MQSFSATNILPIKAFAVDELADVVVLAGPNGVGKTRLIAALVQSFRSPQSHPNIKCQVRATSAAERAAWGTDVLDASDPTDAAKLATTFQQSRRRSDWSSSIIQFESDRSIRQVHPYQFNWNFSDPFAEDPGWELTFDGLQSRFQDTVHSLFRKVLSHRDEIARTAEALRREGQRNMALDWPDPLASFKAAFEQLLAPKRLIDPDPQQQQLQYEFNGQRFPLNTLSSGEREVVNIVFDFLLRNPSHSIVIFDEPELHLHPELSYRLLQTLRTVGHKNQFIFCTHSPEIITASLDQTVIFVGPTKADAGNQAIVVRPDDSTNQALKLLGQSIGIVALGKRIVLVEGTQGSLDKQTYGTILRNRYPDLVLVPAGGRGLITSFDRILSDVLERSIWGVQFFMLCDRDSIPPSEAASGIEGRANGRLRVLPRYHLENYFLDEGVLADVFAELEPSESWLRDPARIRKELRLQAEQHVSTAVALIVSAELRTRVGNVDVKPKGVHNKALDEVVRLFIGECASEAARVHRTLNPDHVEALVRDTEAHIRSTLDKDSDDRWKSVIPGRPIFNAFASRAGLTSARLKQAYIARAVSSGSSCFEEIDRIFAGFSAVSATPNAQEAPSSSVVKANH